ncbi:M23 family metallopeptidase [Leucobacter sp. OH1287]|uniref:M23 family metallopeptidase n=1 Tax=Leucobacter sp. OH1287 TaxID=2491049 RepID=UPI000F5DE236|nr:M23 family metallopeptidase [Leucobacter sp. OH1287]RRD61308.1 M23 family peptidase [Leucobacter sp. OH1287]
MAEALKKKILRAGVAGALVFAITGTGAVAQQFNASPAAALDLPTWDDVQAAKANEAAAAQKVTEIEGLIEQVKSEVATLQQAAVDAQAKAAAAMEEFNAADQKTQRLQEQASESQQKAEATAQSAASIVSQMYRSGGVDRNLELFIDSDADTADALLDRLASMSKATERNSKLSDDATQAMNTAVSLGKQAEEAEAERERLWQESEQEYQNAGKAVEDARVRQQQAEDNQRELEAQLAALKDQTTTTVAGYQERLRIEAEERRRREEEAARQAAAAAEEARRRAAAAAASANSGSRGGGGGGGGGVVVAPPASSGGWSAPLPAGSYRTTCPFLCYYGHDGHDLGAPAWTPIYAAASGRVYFSGWDRLGGNAVFIDHGAGVHTWYGHMVTAPAVGYGQWVGQGQIIGYVGMTGLATGNHLHFATRVYGVAQNPYNFMAARGVYLN